MNEGLVQHKITLKNATTYNSLNLSDVNYHFDRMNDVLQITEVIHGPIITNLYSLDIDTQGATITWVINRLIEFFVKLKQLNLVFKRSTTLDFGKHFCNYIAMVVSIRDGIELNYLEKHTLIRNTKKTHDETLFKNVLKAFLFERVSSKRKDQPIICTSACKLKKFRGKFSKFDYRQIHHLLCFNQYELVDYPELELLFEKAS